MSIKFHHIAAILVFTFGILLMFTSPQILTGSATAQLPSSNLFTSIVGIVLIIAALFLLRSEISW